MQKLARSLCLICCVLLFVVLWERDGSRVGLSGAPIRDLTPEVIQAKEVGSGRGGCRYFNLAVKNPDGSIEHVDVKVRLLPSHPLSFFVPSGIEWP